MITCRQRFIVSSCPSLILDRCCEIDEPAELDAASAALLPILDESRQQLTLAACPPKEWLNSHRIRNQALRWQSSSLRNRNLLLIEDRAGLDGISRKTSVAHKRDGWVNDGSVIPGIRPTARITVRLAKAPG